MKITRKRTVTIIADGSHCPDTNAYGWAFYITHGMSRRHNRILRFGGGYGCPDSNEAELMAINVAIDTIIRKGLIYNQKVVIISDCQAVRNLLDRKRLLEFGAKNVRLRHVKGHQNVQQMELVDEIVHWQHWCDRAARRTMRRNRDLYYALQESP